ncbi:alanine--tRNA ligase [Striga asiatica]|uniref:Alanine--tRNA ligase n=1 Tax=Striga asiatica TaxID=4170 RepID=A0A5A7R613_STRAF|nr:alanine--tRNA ligase [Striga asiatica]
MGVSETPTLLMDICTGWPEVTTRWLAGERDGTVEAKGRERRDDGERERGRSEGGGGRETADREWRRRSPGKILVQRFKIIFLSYHTSSLTSYLLTHRTRRFTRINTIGSQPFSKPPKIKHISKLSSFLNNSYLSVPVNHDKNRKSGGFHT